MNNTGQKLYLKAKKVILGGNMLLSKRPEMTLPNLWPAYYSKSKKIFVLIDKFLSKKFENKLNTYPFQG